MYIFNINIFVRRVPNMKETERIRRIAQTSTGTVEGTNFATLEQHVFIKHLTHHKQRRRLPYKAMCLEPKTATSPHYFRLSALYLPGTIHI